MKRIASLAAMLVFAAGGTLAAIQPAYACPPGWSQHGRVCIAPPAPKCTFWQEVRGRVDGCQQTRWFPWNVKDRRRG